MSGEYVVRLKRRALKFLETSEKSDDPDLSTFLAEQAIQLYVKGVYYEIVGEKIRGHGIRSLLGSLSRELERNGIKHDELDRFVRERRDLLVDLEEAYTESRYGEGDYTEDKSRVFISLAKETIELLKEVERNAMD
ncbi:HEPN domain-containing protein [Sulfuracidifex tepidarius]|uniref:HEPN domain-containing protein n=1 Tax=Sulfuracidifex tepidarius TaxID=1294262 RepID=A0A510E5V4_9CREN|nr:HEPN domain-containing protein [Sulfuracidifex tepidarius]BBG25126.1 hypothetical protein IC006_2461 [Sulfuracidifex tepidarius]BBG27913.1 hypothetical protein IC007_2468 [Sulfuracidifex tepidarius]